MANEENTCDFCQRDNFNPNDNLCAGCRKLLGANVVTTNLPGVQGAFDMATKAMMAHMLTLVPAWKEMMGQPLIGEIEVEPMKYRQSPGMSVRIEIRFHEPPPKPSNTKGTK